MTITQAQLTSEISNLWPDNTTGAITPANARTTLNDITTAIFQGISTANTWTALQTFNGGINEIFSNPSSFILNNVFNNISVATDNLDASAIGNVAVAFNIYHGFGGSSTKGAREGFQVNAQLLAPTSSSNTNRNYVGGTFECQAISNDGGGVGSEKGAIFGCNPVALLSASATNMAQLIGGEVDIAAATGSSVLDKYGWSIIQLSTDGIQGSRNDAALYFVNQAGAVGWKTLIQIGNGIDASPLTTSGSILSIKGSPTITNGIDLSGATVSGSAFKSPGFTVDGSGNTTLSVNSSGQFNINNPSGQFSMLQLEHAGGIATQMYWDNTNSIYNFNTVAGLIQFNINSVGALKIFNSGGIGIGSAPTDPAAGGLHVGADAGIGTPAVTSSFLALGAATTAKSEMRFNVGGPPTSPVDGDVWFESNTNTGLKIRINGVTKSFTVA